MLSLFNPRDVKVALINAQGVAAGAAAVFPAPATAIARLRYILAFSVASNALAQVAPISLEVVTGAQLLIADPGARTPPGFCVLNTPLLAGVPGFNALQIRNNGGLADTLSAWVQFADVQVAIEPEIFRS